MQAHNQPIQLANLAAHNAGLLSQSEIKAPSEAELVVSSSGSKRKAEALEAGVFPTETEAASPKKPKHDAKKLADSSAALEAKSEVFDLTLDEEIEEKEKSKTPLNGSYLAMQALMLPQTPAPTPQVDLKKRVEQLEDQNALLTTLCVALNAKQQSDAQASHAQLEHVNEVLDKFNTQLAQQSNTLQLQTAEIKQRIAVNAGVNDMAIQVGTLIQDHIKYTLHLETKAVEREAKLSEKVQAELLAIDVRLKSCEVDVGLFKLQAAEMSKQLQSIMEHSPSSALQDHLKNLNTAVGLFSAKANEMSKGLEKLQSKREADRKDPVSQFTL